MIRHVMRFGLYLLAAIGALYLVMLGMFFFSREFCEISTVASFPSPTWKFAVDVQNSACRGKEPVTAAWLRMASTTSPSGHTLTELWTSPPLVGALPSDVGSSPVHAQWIDESIVKVAVPRGTRNVLEREFEGVTIVYVERE
jgi:hypothetical protein